VIGSLEMSMSHWERNLRKYEHLAEPLFNIFTSIEALSWTLVVRNIDTLGLELHLRGVEVLKPSTCPMAVALLKPAKLESWIL